MIRLAYYSVYPFIYVLRCREDVVLYTYLNLCMIYY